MFTRASLKTSFEVKSSGYAVCVVKPPRKAYSLASSAFLAADAPCQFSLFKPVFREVHKRLPYAIIIIRNVIYEMLGKNARLECDELTEDIIGNERSVEDIALGNIYSVELEEFIRSMPEALRQAITLKLTYDMTNRQIADVLGISEGAARKRISNAYKRINAFLNGGNGNE